MRYQYLLIDSRGEPVARVSSDDGPEKHVWRVQVDDGDVKRVSRIVAMSFCEPRS